MGILVRAKDVVDSKIETWQGIISNVVDLEMNQNNLTARHEIIRIQTIKRKKFKSMPSENYKNIKFKQEKSNFFI